MAKRKPAVLTPEERLEENRLHELSRLTQDFKHVPDNPTYTFSIGDKVRYGAFKEVVVEDFFLDFKVYLLKCTRQLTESQILSQQRFGDTSAVETSYVMAMWQDIRPLTMQDTAFAENRDLRISYSNSTVESLMHYHYHFGIDFNPDYQRGIVWTAKDKELLLDSIFKNADIGKFVLVHLNDKEWTERNVGYEILDGKQRLLTLLEFYENRFPYHGMFYNDLSMSDRRAFKEHPVVVGQLRDDFASKAEFKKMVLRCFLMLNRGGRAMDKEHLDAIEHKLKTLEEGCE